MLGMGNFPDFPGKNLGPIKRDQERRPLSHNYIIFIILMIFQLILSKVAPIFARWIANTDLEEEEIISAIVKGMY